MNEKEDWARAMSPLSFLFKWQNHFTESLLSVTGNLQRQSGMATQWEIVLQKPAIAT